MLRYWTDSRPANALADAAAREVYSRWFIARNINVKISALTTRPWAATRMAARILSSLPTACLVVCAPITGQAQSDSGATQPLPDVTVTAPRPPTAQQLAGPSVAHFISHHAALSVALGHRRRPGAPQSPVSRRLEVGSQSRERQHTGADDEPVPRRALTAALKPDGHADC